MNQNFEDHSLVLFVISTNKIFERCFYEFVLGNLVYLYLLIMILKRYLKNREIADLRKKNLTRSIKNKMFLIGIIIILKILAIIASFNLEKIWLYDVHYYSLLYIFQVFVLLIQIRMMKFEFSKTIPYSWFIHHLFWILLTILHALYLVNTFVIQCDYLDFECLIPNSIFDITRLAVSGALTLYNLIFKFQDLPDYEMILKSNLSKNLGQSIQFETLKTPLLKKREQEETPFEESPKKLRFKVFIKNKLINNNSRVYFQINLELCPEKSIKLMKTIEDFIKLDQNIQETKTSFLFSNDCPPLPKLSFRKPSNNNLFSSDFFLKQRSLFENYLKVFLENELYPLVLLEFLEIKEPFKTKCIQIFHKKFFLKEGNLNFGSILNDEEKNDRSISISSVAFAENESKPEIFLKGDEKTEDSFMKKRFCGYFNIQMKEWVKENKADHFSFIFQLSLIEKPEEFWKINKRYSDFIRLDQELKKVLHRKLPELPEKKILLDSTILNKRGRKLAKYLRTLLNEKVYFNDILFEFIKLNNENYEILMNTQFNLEPNLYKASVLDHTVIISNEDKQPYIAYLIKIIKFSDINLINIVKEHTIIKRFSDFERLNKVLLIRFGEAKNFPIFPSKIPSFSTMETIIYRKQAFEKYLNELFKIENIEDSIVFRKFMNVDPKDKENFIMNVSNMEEKESFLENSD